MRRKKLTVPEGYISHGEAITELQTFMFLNGRKAIALFAIGQKGEILDIVGTTSTQAEGELCNTLEALVSRLRFEHDLEAAQRKTAQ